MTMDARGNSGRAVKILIAGFLILLVNSSYLAAYAEPTLVYFGNIALHILLGAVLAIGFAIYAIRRFKAFAWPLRMAAILFGLSAGFGAYITKYGTTRPYRWALYTHIASAVAGSILLLILLLGAVIHHSPSRKQSFVYVAIACMIFVFPVAATAYNRYTGAMLNRSKSFS